ncbi:MAG: lytic transglycosylase domain-containing protein [Colwellia sp.]|nr:lytic transglycosylase domain-containing protein [Colwellia sp.]
MGYANNSNATETRIYKYKSINGVISFSDIEPLKVTFEKIRIGCYACKLKSSVDWHNAKLYLSQYQQDITKAAQRYRVEPAFIRAIIHAESHFDVHAQSKQGAQGLMQLMPNTAKALGVNNAFVAQQNINGGVKHLSRLLEKYQGNKRLVTAAYNAGEGAVKKYSGIPPFTETQLYVERVEILHKRYKKAIKL